MMARLPGTQCDVPALVFSAPAPKLPKEHTPLKEALAAARARDSKAGSEYKMPDKAAAQERATPLSQPQPEQPMTREEFDGELPSIGSEGHFDGTCKRCAFFSKGRCRNGKDCTHCHFAHEPRSRMRKRCA